MTAQKPLSVTAQPPPALAEATARLDKYIDEDRLLRGMWTEGPCGPDGYERACLLAAMWPECGATESQSVCPASLMPAWLAHLTLWIADAGSVERWPEHVRRYARLAHRWHVLTDEDWHRLDYLCRSVSVERAMENTENELAVAVCRTVLDLCERVYDERLPDPDVKEWANAGKTAESAAETILQTEKARDAGVPGSGWWSAEGARARDAIAVAAEAAEIADRATAGAMWANGYTETDCMIDEVLGTIEMAIVKREIEDDQ